MERLWSTWRSDFIDGHKETQGEESPFVRAWREPEHDAENMMVHRGESAFIIMNKYPYNPGHLLILPAREIADPLDLDDDEWSEMMALTRYGIRLLRAALKPDGINAGMNIGVAAGAAIPRHLHYHLVPRWNGDSNFMPVLADVRVMSKRLEDIWQVIRKAGEGVGKGSGE